MPINFLWTYFHFLKKISMNSNYVNYSYEINDVKINDVFSCINVCVILWIQSNIIK